MKCSLQTSVLNLVNLACIIIGLGLLGDLAWPKQCADTRSVKTSASSNQLAVPPFKLSTVDKRAFPVSGAIFWIWNKLPPHVSLHLGYWSGQGHWSQCLNLKFNFGAYNIHVVVLVYCCWVAGLISEVSEEKPLKSPKIAVVNNPTLIWGPRQEEPLLYGHISGVILAPELKWVWTLAPLWLDDG